MPCQPDRPGHRALRRGRCSLAGEIYHVTTTTFGREPLFRRFGVACAAASTITAQEVLGDSRLLAWVLMPDHLHLLLQLGDRDHLPTVVSRLKARSAASVARSVGRRRKVWSRAYHDHALRGEEDVQAVARYIIANPLRAGLVRRCGDYPFWDAVWLS